MKKIVILLLAAAFCSTCIAQDSSKTPDITVRLTICGTIKNYDEFVALVQPETYIQLVPLLADGKFGFNIDRLGRWAYDSDLPRLSVPKKAVFSFDVPNIHPGRYFLAAQRLKAHEYGNRPIFLTETKTPFIIDVPADAKSLLSIDAGDLIVWTH
jgi:hypothetical protein